MMGVFLQTLRVFRLLKDSVEAGTVFNIRLQFYVQEGIGLRLLSKEDVVLYLKAAKISTNYDTNGQCDISSDDNVSLFPQLVLLDEHIQLF
jgi:hypothetical protein